MMKLQNNRKNVATQRMKPLAMKFLAFSTPNVLSLGKIKVETIALEEARAYVSIGRCGIGVRSAIQIVETKRF
jgi:hypothetical protein